MSPKPMFVVIPGLFHQASHFDGLVSALHKRSYRAIAMDLPTVGDNPPQMTMQELCDFIRNELKLLLDQGQDIILVAHSVGGRMGSTCVKGLEKQPDRPAACGIVGVVWVTAFIAADGETGLNLIQSGVFQPPDAARPEGDYFVPNEKCEELLYDDEPEDLRRLALAQLKPQTMDMSAMTEPIQGTCWDIKHLPKTYIFMRQDRGLVFQHQQNLLNRVRKLTNDEGEQSSWTLEYMDCGHSPFLSKREELADLLVKSAKRSEAAY